MSKDLKAASLAAVLCLGISSPAPAGPLEDGASAYEQGNYAAALGLWRPLAERGLPEAQFNLGRMYEKGHGVPRDRAEAVRWYRAAAARGHVKAQHTLGLLYAAGEGVTRDEIQAYAWWDLAAENGRQEARMMRDVLRLKLSRSERDEAEALARTLKARAAP